MSAGAGRDAGIPEISPASHSAEEKKPIRKLHFLKGLSFAVRRQLQAALEQSA